MNSIELSIVTSMYSSGPYLAEFCRRAGAAAQTMTPHYEIVLVNDGSPDDALEKAIALQTHDPHLIVVDLSRNFGHHQALLTGLEYALGRHIFMVDCDLEEDPAWLVAFFETLRSRQADVVYGVQDRRKGGFSERCSGWIFYKVFNQLSNIHIPANATTARLMNRHYADALLQYGEKEIFLPGLWSHAGYRQVPQAVHKESKGSTSYSWPHKLRLMVNAITSFSNKPLVFIFYTGLLLSLLAGLYILFLLIRRFFRGVPIVGWSSLIVSVWFLGGLTIFFIGILGIYLAKMFSEIKQRPRSIVRQVIPAARDHVSPIAR